MFTNYFCSPKKLARFSFIMIVAFILAFPLSASADPVQENITANEEKSVSEINKELLEGRELLSVSEKVRVPITMYSDPDPFSFDINSYSIQAAPVKITGYVDFYIKTYTGRMVVPFYEMSIDQPKNAFLTAYAFGVYYSGNQFNGGDEGQVDEGPVPSLRRTHTAEGLGNIYTAPGTYSVSLKTGGYSTNLGVGFIIPQEATRHFKFDI
ncbi:hypothetical protein [Paenibacillus odorifer]|uniref:hypothetical protein n=1 Tax=Paenibacillus odorifer TaxID=189426 RepID=UPI00096D7696|nr:hypothetical protein [Paenibacillus odorifer]OMD10608.1 hypothetical protein BJP50_28245 [Paenibacillus odorifer]